MTTPCDASSTGVSAMAAPTAERRSTVLIVDDRAANRDTLVKLLESEPGLRLIEASCGPEALQLAADHQPDLVLLDIMMPGMDGYEVCRRLRADPRQAEVPVIMITALDDRDSRITGLEAGADDFVAKPFNRAELRARVRTIIRLNRYRRLHEMRSQIEVVESRFRTLAEHSDEMFWFCSMDPHRILYLSPAIERMWGLPGERFLANTALFRKMIHADDLPVVQQAWKALLERTAPRLDVEFRIVRPDGGVRWLMSSGTPIFNATGVLTGLGGVVRDITERRFSEERIREQASIIDQAPLALLTVEPDTRVRYCNQSAADLLGLTVRELVGRTAEEVFLPETLAAFEKARAVALASGRWTGELLLKTRFGRQLQTEYHMYLIHDAAGRLVAHLNVIIDITEKKQLEEHMLRMQRLENLGMLAAGIAHDFNNALAPITLMAPLLRHYVSDPQAQQIIDTVEKSAGRSAALVRQLLTFARGSAEGLQVVQMRGMLEELAGLVASTFPRGIQVDLRLPDGLWTVVGNPTQIHQIFLNLCVNARDAMPGGGTLCLAASNVALSEHEAAALPGGRAGEFLMVAVRDTGTGMTPEVLARIWDPFFTTKGEGKGTGLGLSTVRGIVANHRGFLTVETGPGAGTEFRVFLPAGRS